MNKEIILHGKWRINKVIPIQLEYDISNNFISHRRQQTLSNSGYNIQLNYELHKLMIKKVKLETAKMPENNVSSDFVFVLQK